MTVLTTVSIASMRHAYIAILARLYRSLSLSSHLFVSQSLCLLISIGVSDNDETAIQVHAVYQNRSHEFREMTCAFFDASILANIP